MRWHTDVICLYTVSTVAWLVWFFQAGLSRDRVRIRSPYGTTIAIKTRVPGLHTPVKLNDPMFISFDALPACDGQMDTPPIAK